MSQRPILKILAILSLAMIAWSLDAQAKVKLPETAPIPETHEPEKQKTPEAEIPLPEPRPQPVPEAAKPADKNGETAEPVDKPGEKQEKPADPRSGVRADTSGTMTEAEMACRRELQTLQVTFENRPALFDQAVGCSVPYPLMIKSLGPNTKLEPGAEMNCPMGLAAAKFARDVISPAAKAELGKDVASISQASAYVCRPRNGTTTISEHAFGNALDIAAFKLSDGETIDVQANAGEKADKFLAAVRKAACGPFKTVLGPGSDADHALHLHFDLEPRRNGGTFCQ